jgi:AcrR family transcriptional regulator
MWFCHGQCPPVAEFSDQLPNKEANVARQAVTRREVLNQSAKLFAAHGYRSTSLELVSKRLGVTRQALYYHFRSKGDILGALFDELMTKLESSAAAAEQSRTDAEPRFVTLLRAHIEVCIANLDLLALLLHERPEIAKIDALRANKRRREYTQNFIEAYDEGVAEGALLPLDSWIAVNTLLSAANGVSTWYRGTRAAQGSLEHFRDQVLALLCHGHVAPGTLNTEIGK